MFNKKWITKSEPLDSWASKLSFSRIRLNCCSWIIMVRWHGMACLFAGVSLPLKCIQLKFRTNSKALTMNGGAQFILKNFEANIHGSTLPLLSLSLAIYMWVYQQSKLTPHKISPVFSGVLNSYYFNFEFWSSVKTLKIENRLSNKICFIYLENPYSTYLFLKSLLMWFLM